MIDHLLSINLVNWLAYLITVSALFIFMNRISDSYRLPIIIAILALSIFILQEIYVRLSLFEIFFNVKDMTVTHIVMMFLLSSSFLLATTTRLKKDFLYYYGLLVFSSIISVFLIQGSYLIGFDIGVIISSS